MAVTSLWRIKGNIGKVILYAENPNKTVKSEVIEIKNSENALNDVIDYTQRDSATEVKKFVSGINCSPKNAADEMIKVKKHFGKTGGVIAYHGYQSFQQDEVTPELAHKIGVELANILWGDKYQVVVTTHLDKESHLHNHFVLNTVSFVDGKKYHRTKDDYRLMRDTSDKLCRENGLSFIRYPKEKTGKPYTEYMAEKNGEPTKNAIIRRDIDECINASVVQEQFIKEMQKRGYTFDFSHKYITVNHQNFSKPRRLKTLGENYAPQAIAQRIANNWFNQRKEYPNQDNPEDLFFEGDKNNPLIFRDYQTVYVHFVCGLSVVKERGDYNRELQRLLADDLIKFDKRVEEQNLLLDNDLYTDEDISAFKERNLSEIRELTDIRQSCRNEIKKAERSGDEDKKRELSNSIKDISSRLALLRKQVKICDRITDNEPKIEKSLNYIRNPKEKDLQNTKQRIKNKEKEL